jgi:serine/threonine protein kinase/tetratricopeptide (TPR) repeat protein
MPADPQQVEALARAAAAADPDHRAAFLADACGPDADLRRRVEQRLADPDGPGSPPGPAVPTADERPLAEGAGTFVGPYKLLEQLGEGGMGTVWMAQQTEPIRRRVAVKVVKAGMDSRQVLARFEAERQALALMDHPHIARVLDAGTTPSGRPFFVMELVKGVPLTAFCDQRRLSAHDRLLVFQQVCLAVQHAHQKGVIHRDLKPSNVLVESHDGTPVPKVIDFGLAKAINELPLTERTLVTNFGALLGTPLYMAPEQAEFSALDVDTRADIYALGVILYELLTGTTPVEKGRLAKAAWDEVRRVIREEEPERPSARLSTLEARASVAASRQSEPHKLGKYVRGDLDWIVMKALAKERDRRYQTASALASDVGRFLGHEPVSAGPPTAGYRLRKFVRRNRGAVAVAAAVLGLVLLGAVGLVVGVVALRAEQRRTAEALAQVTAEQARTARALAAETRAQQQARGALNAMTDDVIETLLARQPQLGETERAFLRKVVGFYEAFAAEKGESEEARAVAADGQYRVANLRAFLGERSEAVAGYGEAIRLLDRLAADFPASPDYRRQLAASHNNLGGLLRELGKHPEAEAAYRQALALQEKLAADFPAVPEYRGDLARSHNNLGSLLRGLGKRAEAEASYRRALAIREKLAADFPAEPVYRQDLAGSHYSLGILLRELGNRAAAAADRRALAIREKLAAEFPAVPAYRRDLARSHSNLGILLAEWGKRPAAEAAFRQALAIEEKLAADFPAVPAYRQQLANSYTNLGRLLGELGKRPEAEAAFRRALAIGEKLAAEFPAVPDYRRDLANSYNELGAQLYELSKLPEAEGAYRQALAIQEKLAADFPAVPAYRANLAGSCVNFGDVLLLQKRAPDSLEWFARAIPLLEANLAADARAVKDREFLRNAHQGRAGALTSLHRYPEAIQDWDRAIELDDGAERPTIRVLRAATMAHAGDWAGAVAVADEQTRDGKASGDTLCAAACVYALSVPAVKGDARLRERHAARAMDLLRRARDAGYFRGRAWVEELRTQDDLAALRDRADFQQLLQDLQQKFPPPGP